MVPLVMRRLLVVVVLAVTLAACETSNLDRSAAVAVSGRVLQADGSPAGGVPVALEREPTVGEVVTGLIVVPLTFFTACLTDPPAALCRGRSVKRAKTGADGTYSFNLSGDDTQTAFGNARSFTLSTGTGEQAGPAVTASFKIQTEALALPDLQLWQAAVTVAAGRIGWSPPAAGEYRVMLEDTAGQPVWTFDSPRAEVVFDPRILEDTVGSLAVAARTTATAEGTSVAIRRQSGRVTYRSAAGPPHSRGRPCTLASAASVTPCPLTDGNFVNSLPPVTTTTAPAGPTVPPARDAVTVDLGRPVDVTLMVIRGCSCDVERSLDGLTWTAVGHASGLTALVPSRAGAARYVRLTGLLSDLHEVSVWEGGAPPAPPAATGSRPAATPAAPSAPAAIAPASGEPSRTAPALVALVALVLVATATAAGALAVRRRTTG